MRLRDVALVEAAVERREREREQQRSEGNQWTLRRVGAERERERERIDALIIDAEQKWGTTRARARRTAVCLAGN